MWWSLIAGKLVMAQNHLSLDGTVFCLAIHQWPEPSCHLSVSVWSWYCHGSISDYISPHVHSVGFKAKLFQTWRFCSLPFEFIDCSFFFIIVLYIFCIFFAILVQYSTVCFYFTLWIHRCFCRFFCYIGKQCFPKKAHPWALGFPHLRRVFLWSPQQGRAVERRQSVVARSVLLDPWQHRRTDSCLPGKEFVYA